MDLNSSFYFYVVTGNQPNVVKGAPQKLWFFPSPYWSSVYEPAGIGRGPLSSRRTQGKSASWISDFRIADFIPSLFHLRMAIIFEQHRGLKFYTKLDKKDHPDAKLHCRYQAVASRQCVQPHESEHLAEFFWFRVSRPPTKDAILSEFRLSKCPWLQLWTMFPSRILCRILTLYTHIANK